MTRGPRIARWILAAVAALIAVGPAAAGLLPVQVTVQPESGNYRWTYAIVLPTDMKLQSGNYFTVYDFNGYINGTAAGPDANWSVSVQNTGVTDPLLNPIDDPSLPNLVFRYSGPTIPAGQLGLGNFIANSTFGDRIETSFTAQTNRTSDGKKDVNITSTTVPVPSATQNVPEPATLVLVGLGVPLAALARRRKRAAAAPATCG